MSDRRYSTARWQRLRKAILARDGHVCSIQGARCTGIADTVDHIFPSSTHPHLFWAPENLRSACRRCNYGGGARVQADNRRRQIAQLEQLVKQQGQQITELLAKLAAYEDASGGTPRSPAIY
jgi:5-methylcytosine-specific restriction endonuclease McrA